MADNVHFNVTNDFEKAKKDFTRLGNSIGSTSKKFDSSTASFNRMRKSVRNLSQDANSTAGSFTRMSRAMSMFKNGMNLFVMNKMAEGIAKVIQNSMDAIEILNMFEVSMGSLAEETDKELKAITELSGIDLTTLRQATGTFTLLAKSMGMSEEAATRLGKNATKMSADLSSLFNIPINQVMADLKSGLIGQTETVYKYGMDLTEASLANEALRLGIDKSVRTMGQGEKMFLRMSVAMRQSSASVGDFARTIETPANQIRLLGENILTLSRTIGSVFIPVIGAVIPYIRAFIMVLNELFRALGMIFGVSSSGGASNMEDKFTGVGGAVDDLDGGLGKASGSAKKLKKAIDDISAPFDELNTVNIPEDTGSGGGGAGGLGGLDPLVLGSMKDYDMMLGGIKQKASDIRDRVMEWLGFQQRVDEKTGETFWKLKEGYTNFEKIRDIVNAIGIGFLSWKIRNDLLDDSKGLGLALLVISTKIKDIIALFSLMAEFGIMKTLVDLFGKAALLAVGWAAAIAVMVLRFNYLNQNSKVFKLGLETIVGWIGKMISGIGIFLGKLGEATAFILSPLAGAFKGISEFIHNIGLDMGDLTLTTLGFGLLFTPAAPIGVALLVFEAITVAVRAIGYAASDAIDEVDLFGGVSKKTANKMQPMLDRLRHLDDALTTLEYTGEIIDDSVIEDVKNKTAAIRENILNELDADRNASLATLNPLKNTMSPEMYNKILARNEEYYNKVTLQVTNGQTEIDSIIASSKGVPLSAENAARIAEIQATLSDTTVRHFSETEVEVQKIMENMKTATGRTALEQAVEILSKTRETRDGAIEDAKTQFAGVQLAAENMKATTGMTDEEYNAMITSAELARDKSIEAANTQYDTVEKRTKDGLGELSSNMNYETGEMKTKWQVFCEENTKEFENFMENINTSSSIKLKEFTDKWNEVWSTWWDEDVAPWFTKEKWLGLFDSIRTSLETKWNEVVSWWESSALVTWWSNNVAPWFTEQKWSSLYSSIKTSLKTTWDSTAGEWGTNISNWWNNSVAPWFTTSKWLGLTSGMKEGLVDGFKSAFNGVIDVVEKALNWIIDNINTISFTVPSIVPGIGGSTVGVNLPKVKMNRLARGGMLTDGMLFEAGEGGKAELLGQYNNKTTVMPLENSGFVEAMYQAVYSATAAAQSSGGQVIEVVANLDGDVIYKNQQKVASQRGVEFGLGEFVR